MMPYIIIDQKLPLNIKITLEAIKMIIHLFLFYFGLTDSHTISNDCIVSVRGFYWRRTTLAYLGFG